MFGPSGFPPEGLFILPSGLLARRLFLSISISLRGMVPCGINEKNKGEIHMKKDNTGEPSSARLSPVSRTRAGEHAPAPAHTHARAACPPEADRRDILDIPCSQTACAGAHARVRNPAAYFKAWREAKFGADIDPVRAAVDEAVAAFSTKTPETDRLIWLKIANRVGADEFMRAVWLKQSENDSDRTVLRDTASAFQNLLNRRFPKPGTKGGAA